MLDKNIITPTPFCINQNNIRAIVLGADPTISDDTQKPVHITKAFGIGDGDPRYFQGVLNNLKMVGLTLEDIYVTNMISGQLEAETSKNKNWMLQAEQSMPSLIDELDNIDPDRKIPVLITAEIIYKLLLKDNCKPSSAKEIYANPKSIPIRKEQNRIGRELIPFYRHPSYMLNIISWLDYRNKITLLINKK